MTKGFESLLDECLNRIAEDQETGLDACVAEHPTLAPELEPLLRLASDLEMLREDEPPSAVALQAGKQKLLREAARLKALEEEKAHARHLPRLPKASILYSWRGLWPINLQYLMRRSAVVVALAALLVVTVLGGRTIAASASSLPGDSLYSVKRVTEELQLALTLNREAKAELVQRLDERRRAEVIAVVNRQRTAEMSFRGRVESMGDSSWTVAGVPVSTSAETALEGEIGIGTLVRVYVRSFSDGSLWASRIAAEPSQTTPEPTPSPTLRPTDTEIPTRVPPTAVPTTPVPPTAAPTRVESQATMPPIKAPTAVPTRTASRVPTRTPTQTRTATPVPPTPPPPREIKVRFTGKIEAMGAQAWTVDGQTVRINSSTRIDESLGRAAVGGTATVLAIRQDDQNLLALEIQIASPPPTPEQPFEFQGLIESWSATQWVVGGHVLIVNGATAIDGSPQKGLLAEVKALRQGDGALLAKHIVVQLPTEEVQFEGLIQVLNGGEWVIEGVTVRIDVQTQIHGTPVVGAVAEVQGLLLPDGAVLGRRIDVLPPPTPTPVPEATPTQATPIEATPTAQSG